MAKILLIDGESIKALDRVKFTEEGKLQDYLEKYPSLIPLAEIVEGASDLLCIGREVIAGPGSVDLLFIDKDGLLTIVETKLAKNPEARRAVIGQIIEYASYISKWTADDVYRIASEHLKSNLDEVMENMGEDFRSNIEQNLRNGKMRLIIAVDELVEPLRATVTFLNSYSNFDILLLRLSSFEESKSKKVLFPSLFGYASKTTERGTQRGRWDEKSFFADIRQRCKQEMTDTVTGLYEFVKANADSVSWGTGASVGSFTFRKLRYEILVSIFTVQSNGLIYINFGEMKGKSRKGNEIKEDVLQSFRAKLNQITGINIPAEAINLGKFPSITGDTLAGAESLKNFQNAVLSLCQQIESGSDNLRSKLETI